MGRVISAANAQAINAAMVEAVEGTLGRQFTAGAKVPGVTTAGKSGTAELGGTGEPHSWFIGFAPAEAPTGRHRRARRAGRPGRRGGGADRRRPDGAVPGGWLVSDDVEPVEPVETPACSPTEPPRAPRPVIERIGLAAIALVLAILFGGVAAASWSVASCSSRSWAAIGCLMTLWVGALTLIRG